jgi:hypothetical protein
VFGAEKKIAAPGAEHGAIVSTPLSTHVMLSRAGEFFGWMAGFILAASLIGFIPAIGLFVVLYMGFGFREPLLRTTIFGAAVVLFCYSVFDRGLSVPWPQSVLGDFLPALRDMTGLL